MRIDLASRFAAAAFALTAFTAQALEITRLTPQGEVAQVRQVVAVFDQAAVRFGDPRAPAPLEVSCSDAEAGNGGGRWTSAKQWVWDFARDLPPGMRCTASVVAGFKSASGAALTGAASYQFNSGGPFVKRIEPEYGDIEEKQVFLLELTGAATEASLLAHVGCVAKGIGERIPVVAVPAPERAAILKATGHAKAAEKEPLRFATLQCNRTLPAGAEVQLVFGKGVATPSGIENKVEKRFDFQVREPFAISFSCERENAQAACLPLRPMTLSFNAPVARKLAAQIVLKGDGQTLQPKFEEAKATDDAVVQSLEFAAPFAEKAAYSIELPAGFEDASGRGPDSPDSFPMKVQTGAMPPLAKFAASPFGVIERLAELDGVAMMPVTVRRVEPALAVQAFTPGRVSDLNPKNDADIIEWFRRVRRYDGADRIDRKTAALDIEGTLPPVIDKYDRDSVQTRMLSLLGGKPGVRQLDMPKAEGGEPRPFEVIGIPLSPGFHVLEIASKKLGDALLDERFGARRTMYVRTTALATNLAVHFKLGRADSLAWVTALDSGKVVAGATVRVSSCDGKEVAKGTTDLEGIVRFAQLSSDPPTCGGYSNEDDRAESQSLGYSSAYFVSARAVTAGSDGADSTPVEDLAFTWSDWQRGIEPWRFNVPTSSSAQPEQIAHTIFDRTLFRAGETVSMKHLIRSQTLNGFGATDWNMTELVITHVGSGQQFKQAVKWHWTDRNGESAENTFQIPVAAKLGEYRVALHGSSAEPGARQGRGRETERSITTGAFRVEEFRLPVFEGRIAPTDAKPLVAATAVPLAAQINFISGGGAANLPVKVSALTRRKSIDFSGFDGFTFAPPQKNSGNASETEEETAPSDDSRIVADKLALTLDANGAGKVTLDKLPPADAPRELLIEATYADPNGEVQTLRSTQSLWPAAIVAGLKTESWVSVDKKLKLQALALDLAGKPLAGVPIEVKAVSHQTTSSRKRLVGGFYTYDNHTETKDLGTVCSGASDAQGLVGCDAALTEPGQVELVVHAKDKDGRESLAANSVYVTKQGELWFAGEDHDRIDVLPEKKRYEPGEVASFQVRSPFRFATALVSVEREGVLESQVVQLEGQDPTIRLTVKPEWGPNTFVSVLALRGRLREVPWYSFFTWGWKAPRQWWTAFKVDGKQYIAPTSLVDLSKPAYRFGMAEIRVGTKAHQLDVEVKTDQPSYQVRGKALVTVSVRLPDGKPAADAEIALAAVDQALLELSPNKSWNLLDAMLARRSWGVSTSTAQMEIVGRRHYGRKAVPAGGGGGQAQTRELLDTLLLWNPRVKLDANGQAKVEVPLNDSLTTFKIVAIADAELGLFGTGQTSIAVTQDLQIISSLPPLVREEDQFRAQFMLRNTTKKAMKVEVAPRAALLDLTPKTVDIPAGESREAAWDVTAPAQLGQTRAELLLWEISAKDASSGAADALKVSQRIVPAVPLTVQQATLVQIGDEGPFTLDVAPPAGALPGRGGLQLALQPKLAEGLPGVRDWFANYPFSCLEQKTSKSVGLRNAAMWQGVLAQLPTYLDKDGLASYFPPRAGDADRGSDILTSYLLAATHEASGINPAFALAADVRAPMEAGLVAFVEGRIQRKFWSPRKDLDVRKLAALEALSRYGKAQGRMLGSITIAPNQWPTSALIDWYNILKRVADVPQRAQRIEEVNTIIRSRLSYQGTRLIFSTEKEDYWWWLMVNGDVNAARLMLAVMDDTGWKDEMGLLASSFIGRQQGGAWHTTTANLWGGLALEKFSKKFEATPVTGTTAARLGTEKAEVDWAKVERIKSTDPEGVARQGRMFGAPAAPGNLRNNTMFLPWPRAVDGAPTNDTLLVTQSGTGKPWLTLQSLAAVPLAAPFASGYAVKKTVTPIEQADKSLPAGSYTRGDVLRITIEVDAAADMTWVVISDPIPGGATILGGGLGRDSQIATRGEKKTGADAPAFEERSFEAYRSYYEFLPKGTVTMEYTVRLNNAGDFALPPTRVEALYAPEVFGETPNARIKIAGTR